MNSNVAINVCWGRITKGIFTIYGLVGVAEKGLVVFYFSQGIEVIPVEQITLCPSYSNPELFHRLFTRAQEHLPIYLYNQENPVFWIEPLKWAV